MIRCRIYHQDRETNEIGYYETIGPSVSYEYLELYLKKNNKKFLYITNIEHGSKEKAPYNWTEYQNKCSKKARESQEAR